MTTLKCLPSTKLVNEDEQRAFEFFKQNTASQFAGHHELAQKFWTVFVPQFAFNDALIFKLAVAMGSKHEAILTGRPESAALASKSHALAISSIARSLPQMNVDVSLLSCGLLMAYANLCEEVPTTAAVHFSLGLKILREQTSEREAIKDSMGAFVVPMFAELELITALFVAWPPTVEVICPQPLLKPELPASFDDLPHAKRILGSLLGWRLYVTVSYQESPAELAAELSGADELLGVWRHMLIRYSMTVAATYPGLYLKARKMLFQYKLFDMCKGAARNDTFLEACRVHVQSMDFSQPHTTSIICVLKGRNPVDGSWRPLAPEPLRRQDDDDLDIWPHGEPMGHDGPYQIIAIALGR